MKRALTLAAALLALSAGWASRADASCSVANTTTVNPSGLQAAVAAIPGIVGGDYCIQMNPGLYNEGISVGTHTFTPPTSRIYISSAIGANGGVVISTFNIGGSIFEILSDSVTLIGVQVKPSATGTFGIYTSSYSHYVTLSSVTVIDPFGFFSFGAAVQINGSYAKVQFSSITATNANGYGLMVTSLSTGSLVAFSTVTSMANGGQSALEVDGASTTVSNCYAQELGNGAAIATGGTSNITVLNSTFTSLNALAGLFSNTSMIRLATAAFTSINFDGLDINSSSVSVFTNMQVKGFTNALVVDGSSHDDLISLSTMTANSAGNRGLYINGASSITITYSIITNTTGDAVKVLGSGYNTISQSSITTNLGGSGFYTSAPGNNLIEDTINDNNGAGVYLDAGANFTQVLKSTATSFSGNYAFFITINASNNTITQSYLGNTVGDVLHIDGASSFNQISLSTMASTGNGGGSAVHIYNTANHNTISGSVISAQGTISPAVLFANASSSNTITTSVIRNTNIGLGNGIMIVSGPFSNVISLSTVTVVGVGASAFYVTGSSMNHITADYLSSPAGDALKLDTGANYNLIGQTTMYSNVAATYKALEMLTASSNSFTNAYMLAPNGTPAALLAGSNYNGFNQSSFTLTSNLFGGALNISASVGNSLFQCYMSGPSATAGFAAVITSVSDYTTIIQSTMVALGGGTSIAAVFDVSHSTITQSVMLASGGGMGVKLAGNSLGSVVSFSQIVASTGVFVSGSTGTVLYNDQITASVGVPNPIGLQLVAGAANIQVGASTITVTPVNNPAISVGPGSSLQGIGPLFVRGDFNVSGAFTAGPFNHLLGRDLNWGAGTTFLNMTGSTVTLDGADLGLTYQRVALPSALSFEDVVVAVSSVSILSDIMATQLTDTVAGSTLTFQAGSPPVGINTLILKGGAGANQLINLRSSTPGTQWKLHLVIQSTVTLTSIQDSNASFGLIAHANDGLSLDGGNNTNWNFLPSLVVQAPGEGWSEGTGKTGAPSNQTAGVSGSYFIRAVSSSSNTVAGASFGVTLVSNDPYGTGPTNVALAAGSINIPSFTLKIAEPGPFFSQVFATTTLPGTAFSPASVSVPVMPNAPTQLQLILNGETEVPGSPSGKTGSPVGPVAGSFLFFKVRGVDAFWNKVVGASANVYVSTSGANLPQTQALVSGTTSFLGAVFASSATGRTMVATDLSFALASSTSAPFTVFTVTNASPTVSVNLANASVQTTLGGAITGTASDPSGVTQVTVVLQNAANNLFLNFNTLSFGAFSSSASTLGSPGGQTTGWSIPIGDAALAANTSYFVVVQSSNASNNVVTSTALFTFNPTFGVVGTSGDGQGAAALMFRIPATGIPDATGCAPKSASMTFVVGGAGIGPGGAIAFRVPDNWGVPVATVAVNPPPAPGGLFVQSPVLYTLAFNPPSQSSVTFGTNWIIYSPNTMLAPGTSVYLTYTGFPGGGAQSVGPQTFPVLVSGGLTGLFKPISVAAAASLTPGAPASLQFSQQTPLTLGPLQTSTTMQLYTADACGNQTTYAFSNQVDLWAGPYGSRQGIGDDVGALFFSTGPGITALVPGRVIIDPNAPASQPFYFKTSFGPGYELVFASSSFLGAPTITARPVNLLASSASISGVSIDTGTYLPGVVTATMTAGSFTGAAVMNFTLSNANLPWEIIISTSNVTYTPEIIHRNGLGQPGRTVNWNGVSDFYPQTLVPPGGPYYVKIRVANGVVEDNSLSLYMAPSAFLYGTVNSTGAFANVQAQGPGTSFANFAVASSTGYFQIFGLQNGFNYNVVATSGAVLNGQFLNLTASSNNVTASNAGTNIGAMPFPTPALLRVRVQIPNPAPSEFWGGVNAQSQATGQQGFGTLHYLASADKSDDGRQSFGGASSTWTIMGLLAGTYDLTVNLQQVGISSAVPGFVVNPGVNDLFIPLARQANVYGWAIVPSTTQYGTWVSVQGTKAGSQRPSAFGGASLNGSQFGVPQTSNTYQLFGLDPGTWTITARAPGFASVSTSIFISSSADIGMPNGAPGSGLDLSLSSGGVLSGTIKITGDSTLLPSKNGSSSGLNLFVSAYNPTTYTNGFAQVFIATSSTLAQSTFSITGLDDGVYFINTFIAGAQPIQSSVTVTGGSGNAVMTTAVNSARVVLGIQMPAGIAPNSAGPYHSVSLYYLGQDVTPTDISDIVFGSTITYNVSSATWTSPPLGGGYFTFTGYNNTTGAAKTISVPLANNSTAFALLDLSPSTFSISGTVAFGADVSFQSGGAEVRVSSIVGVLTYSTSTAYCLQGSNSSNGVVLSNFHLELLPLSDNGGGFLTSPLLSVAQVGGNCLAPNLQNVPNNNSSQGPIDPLLAYVTNINPNGTFTFNNVPPGTYLIRVPTVLGTDPNIEQLPPVRQLVTVTTFSPAGLTFSITKGIAISGKVMLPPGLTDNRTFQVILADGQGNPIKNTYVNLSNSNAGAYAFDHVPDGALALLVQDFGYPKSYGARPVSLNVAGAAVNQDIQLVQTGVIKGKMAVQQFLPNSTTAQFTLITSNNLNQLPGSLQIYAEAKPWFQGGRANEDCLAPAAIVGGGGGGGGGPGGCFGVTLDANDQFVLSGVLPGLYDIHFQSQNSPTDNGSIKLVSSFAPGIQVNGAGTTDIGTFNLTGALTLRGTVYDVVTSSPIANMPMKAKSSLTQNDGSDTPSATTDASGRYELVGLDPTVKVYDIYAGARSDQSTSGAIPPYELKIALSVDVTTVSVVNFALTPAPYSFSGSVAGVAGGPALQQPFGNNSATPPAGAVVFCQKVGVAPHDNPIADIQQPSDAQGNFVIPSLTTGAYRLTAVSLGYASVSKTVSITTASVNVGQMTLSLGATLSGALHKPDGSSPSQSELNSIVAVNSDFSQLLIATLTKDPNTNSVTRYSLAGFQPGVSYRVLLFGSSDNGTAPPEAQNIVFSTTTETRTLDLLMRPAAPYVFSKAKKSLGNFKVTLQLSQPLRQKIAADDNLSAILSTFSAAGTLTQIQLDSSRSQLTATYIPGVAESSFTLSLRGYSTQTDPNSLDPVNPQFVYNSTFGYFSGLDGYYANILSNFNGGTLLVEDDNGRVAIPGGAFQVDASSSISIGLAVSAETLAGAATSGLHGAAANISAMRYKGSAYPQGLFQAMAATPPQVNPLSSFYNILLPLGLRTALAKPVPMTIAYSSNTDPTTLNLYWYNAAANAYVLQQDVLGNKPLIDPINHTITINVNHFSTFVMFNTGVAVISGNQFAGDFTAYNFPNPFDLSVKSVTPIHGVAAQTVRGTMISIAVPPDVTGDATVRIFNVAGEKVRTISMGTVNGGQFLYQPWDGRNDSGRDVASGVYIGQVKVGNRSKFFKMALIK